jgi:hypothetical protein
MTVARRRAPLICGAFPRPAWACRNSAASRSTAASSRGASPGAGLVPIHCSISRATMLISGKPYEPPEPASR